MPKSYIIAATIENCERHIKISEDATFLLLHDGLWNAFEFERGHAAHFFLNGETEAEIDHFFDTVEYDDDTQIETTLKDAGLYIGQKFVDYIISSGCWIFECEVLDIVEGASDDSEIVYEDGKPPVQYMTEKEYRRRMRLKEKTAKSDEAKSTNNDIKQALRIAKALQSDTKSPVGDTCAMCGTHEVLHHIQLKEGPLHLCADCNIHMQYMGDCDEKIKELRSKRSLTVVDGKKRRHFVFKYAYLPPNISWSAVEAMPITVYENGVAREAAGREYDNDPDHAYEFSTYAPLEADQGKVLDQFRKDITKAVKRKTLEGNKSEFKIANALHRGKQQYGMKEEGVIRICARPAFDEKDSPYFVIDGMEVEPIELALMLTSYEGFNLEFRITK